jgi:acyl-CoA thioester hydrolase
MGQIYEHLLRVRYGETDQMGVVHHANYLLYMEEARTAFMASVGCSYGGLERDGIGLPVRRTEVRYRASARYEDAEDGPFDPSEPFDRPERA